MALDGPTTRIFQVGNEQLPRVHGTQGHASRVRVLSQQDKQGVAFSSPPLDAKDPFTTIRASPQVSEHPIISPENPYMLSDGKVFSNDTLLRMEKKRKVSCKGV